MNLQPLTDHLIVKPLQKEEKSGIVLPEDAKEKAEKGEVVAVGLGRVLDNGNRLEMDIKVGDNIMFKQYAPEEIKVKDETYYVLSQSDVIAIIK
ncbi:MAG: co-chaperone GroES [Patescibacteria group bacterium]